MRRCFALLYTGGLLPSFLAHLLHSAKTRDVGGRGWLGGGVKSLPSGEKTPLRQDRGRRCVSGRDTLISRSIHRNGDTLRSDRSRGRVGCVRLTFFIRPALEEGFLRIVGMKGVSYPVLASS